MAYSSLFHNRERLFAVWIVLGGTGPGGGNTGVIY
jgi:hypothetical protein